MLKSVKKFKGDLLLFSAVISGREIMSRKNPLYAGTKFFFGMLSMLAALFLWAFVAWNGDSEITRTITVPLTCANAASGMEAFNYTGSVAVKVSGNMAILSKLNKKGFTAEVDLSGIAAGKYSLPVTVETPAGTRVVSVKPQLADIEIYRKAEKRFHVDLKPTGENEEAAEPVSAEIMPSAAFVSGPKEEIDKISSVEARVPAEQLRTDNPYTAELIAVDINDKPVVRIVINPKTVVVKPEIIAEGMSVPLKLPLYGQPAAGYEISSVRLTPDSVILKKQLEDASKINYIELPAVDVTGINGNLHTVLSLSSLELAPNIDLVKNDKITVDITLRKGLATKIFPNVAVKIEGAKQDEKWTVSPMHASVIAEGSRAQLDEISETPCDIVADVTSIVTDNIRLPLIFKNEKQGVRIIRIEPEDVLLKREK